ncbi:MAG: hypothetical protein ACXW0R_01515, partial [Gaiellaceae bacterium]
MTDKTYTLEPRPTPRGGRGHWIGPLELAVSNQLITLDGKYVDRRTAKRSARRSIWSALAFAAVLIAVVTAAAVVAVVADIHLTPLGKVIAFSVLAGVGGTVFDWVRKKAGPQFEEEHADSTSVSCPRSALTDVRKRLGRDVQLGAPLDPELTGKPNHLVLRAKTKEDAVALVESLTAPVAPPAPEPVPPAPEPVPRATKVC